MILRWTRSATSLSIAACASSRDRCRTLKFGSSSRFVFLGDDPDGIALEVMAVEREDENLLVIHAMPRRDRYRKQYEEVMKWRK